MTPPFKFGGWLPELRDKRDFRFRASHPGALASLPGSFRFPWVQVPTNQGSTNSCIGHAVATVVHAALMKQRVPAFQPSRLQIYYGARERIGLQSVDAGAYIRDAMKAISEEGVCPESLWPFTSSIIEKPSTEAYVAAAQHRAWLYRRLDNQWLEGEPSVLENVKLSLLEGSPPVFGFVIYSSFDWDSGTANLPNPGDSVLGGHAAVFTGWNDSTRMLSWQSSWGTEFADFGRGLMSYDFVADPWLVSDVWNLTGITAPVA